MGWRYPAQAVCLRVCRRALVLTVNIRMVPTSCRPESKYVDTYGSSHLGDIVRSGAKRSNHSFVFPVPGRMVWRPKAAAAHHLAHSTAPAARYKHRRQEERWGCYARNGKQVQRQQLSQEKQHVRGCGLSSGCAVSAGSGLEAIDGFGASSAISQS